MRIFAINDGHAASTVSSLNGLDFAVGLAPKGYLYTDRPAYRAGQLVNIKGILRWVADDQYTFKPGAAFQLDVYDARGRVIHSNKVELNTFGTFADRFLLPAASAQGDYRIHVHQALSKQSYETTFAVQEYKLEPVRISVDLPRTVYFRGETIEGKIAVKYYYGTPLAGKTVRYRLSDDRIHTATTDDKGEIAFQFETRRYSETQQLQLHVEFPERNLAIVKSVHLATRGFAIAASTLRNVYIAGETFDVTVNVSDPAGKPVATDLKLEVLERVAAGQTRLERQLTARAGERLIESRNLKSAEKDGAARHTVRIDKPGTYILRASGTDRFDNPVSGSHTVTISGDEDKIRLRLLADQHHFKVGDTGKVQIHWRDAPALALVTYEGASILGYRLIPLKKGANALEIPMDSKLAPNFDLAVAVMNANRFHQARSQFRVSRRLQVTLKTNRDTLKPGDELRVEITTTNPQGKPISAELSLGLIQQNLIDIIGDRQSDIQDFFAGGSRKVSVRAASSCTFRYRPSTRAISQTLLAEADRVRQIREELVARRDLEAAPVNGPGGADGGALVLRGAASDFDELAIVLAEVEILDEDLRRLDRVITGPLAGRLTSVAGESQSEVPNFSYSFGLNLNDNSANSPAQQSSVGSMGTVVTNGRARLARGPQSMQRQRPAGFASSGVAGQRFGRSDRNQLAAEGRSSSAAQSESIDASGRSRFSTTRGWNGQTELSRPGSYRIPQAELALQSQRMVDFFGHISNSDKSVVALNQRGEFQVLNGLKVAALQDMAREGLQLLPGMGSAETAYWNPAVVTDKRGKASVTFRLPDNSTAWKLRAKGADVDVLAGSADARIITKRDLFGELKTPLAFTAGDKATVLVEVHNSVVKKGKPIQVRLKTTVGEKSTQITRSYKSDGPGIKELSIPIEVPAGDSVAFELTISSGELVESSSRDVVVRPHGVPVFATASGSANQSTIAFVEHDQGLPVHNSELEILVGPSVNRTLLDAVLGGGISRYESSLMTPRSGFERSISDVLGGVALLTMIGQTRQTDSPDALALAGRVTGALSQIVSSQRDDGGWSWSGRPAAESDRFITSRVVWAFSVARKAGFAVPNDTFNKAVQSLKTAFTKSAQSDREGQAIILHGLAEAGAADFALANRLYRERNSLSPSGLLHVALVLSRLDRKSMANDLLQIVDVPLDQKLAQSSIDTYADRCLPWMQTGVELRALYLLALEEIAPADAAAAKVADWLLAARRGARWSPEKANGPAVTALARWFGGKQRVNEKYTLAIVVNDRLIETLKIDPSIDPSRRVKVPADALIANEPQQIHFNIEGRGRFSYSVVMSGFVAADKLKDTTNKWSVTRTYQPLHGD
ncbi:MAG: MG2 domain-containing protein, partial [Planctomycetaceae bacterium]